MLKAEDIIERVDDKEKEWTDLYDRMEEDYGLWRLEPYRPAPEGQQSVTSNEPRTAADKIIQHIVESVLSIMIEWSDELGNREKTSLVERFLRGMFYQVDERLQAMLQPPLINTVAWYASVRGGFLASRVIVNKTDDGKTFFDVRPCDPRWTYYEVSDNGIMWVARMRFASPASVKDEYGHKVVGIEQQRGVQAKIIDCWDGKENIVVSYDDKMKLNKGGKHDIKHPPFVITPIGNIPQIFSGKYSDTIEDWGESIYAPTRQKHPERNKYLSWLADVAKMNWKPYLEYASSTGRKQPEREAVGAERIQMVGLDGEGMRVPVNPSISEHVQMGLAVTDMEIQRGGPPHTTYGEVPFQISGYAIKLLRSAIYGLLQERTSAIENHLLGISREVIEQFSAGGFEPTKVSGLDERKKWFTLDVKPEDVKGDWLIKMRLAPDLPEDDVAKYTMAQMAAQNQLLSSDTIAEEILKIPDIDVERGRKIEDQAMQIPSVSLLVFAKHYYNQLDDEQKRFMAKFGITGPPSDLDILMAINVERMKLQMPQGPPQGQAPPEKPAMPRPEAQPSQEYSLPPNMAQLEAMRMMGGGI